MIYVIVASHCFVLSTRIVKLSYGLVLWLRLITLRVLSLLGDGCAWHSCTPSPHITMAPVETEYYDLVSDLSFPL